MTLVGATSTRNPAAVFAVGLRATAMKDPCAMAASGMEPAVRVAPVSSRTEKVRPP